MNLNQDRPCLKLNYGSLCSAMDAVMQQGVDRLFLKLFANSNSLAWIYSYKLDWDQEVKGLVGL